MQADRCRRSAGVRTPFLQDPSILNHNYQYITLDIVTLPVVSPGSSTPLQSNPNAGTRRFCRLHAPRLRYEKPDLITGIK